MLDIEFVRSNRALVERLVKERGHEESKVAAVLAADKKYHDLLSEVEKLRAQRNEAAKKRDVEVGRKLKIQLEKVDGKLAEAQVIYQNEVNNLPNLALSEVPIGDASHNKVVTKSGQPTRFEFEPKDHLYLGERHDIIDTQTAAKVSGSRFTYLKKEAVLLELALVNLAMERLVSEGFVPVFPPILIKKEITSKLGYWQAGGNENYYLVTDFEKSKEGAEDPNELYLIGTGEHAVVPMHQGDIIPSTDLPKRYAAFSPCFRREAGTYGKDTRGIIRVHQFDKIEMVSFVHPDEASEEFERLLKIPWELMQELELPVRQVILSTQDISFPAAKTVDIETWFPSQKDYRETHSISTTTDFQARRFNTRYIENGKTGYVHILNGTCFAIGRTLAAIIENYQRSDGSIEVPKVLRKYVGFTEIKAD